MDILHPSPELTPYCLLRDMPEQDDCVITDDETRSGDGKAKKLVCAGCGNIITDEGQRMTVDSQHRHTFFNPAGVVYELGCFRWAPGCLPVGESSAEFSWFAGHVWRVGVCSGCLSHLGWLFESGETSFFGLIVSRLVEAEG
ncbi:cereblon family protein [Desulfopila sp. IMCC35008]|uniref:cereblon family protein n=1 Tax=Desulfopila sp. IMCC35008 TaxID=2653858 RepID=UPI0013D6F273|nr:cereblon family protein [Desulfopila sp. IMCC35008]